MKAQKVVPPELGGKRLGAITKALFDVPWSKARSLIETGKLDVDGVVATDEAKLVPAGATLTVDETRARPETKARLATTSLVHVDRDVVVVEKPAGVSTVPFEDGEKGTLVDLVRAALSRRSGRPEGTLGVVHRLDKDTTGLLVFARSLAAKKSLAQQFRVHSVHRRYVALVHGVVEPQTFRSRLVADRGDGLRGSTSSGAEGQVAITHVRPLEKLRGATLVECQLETGRTHQIRIHLSEAGHMLVGEKVYVRGHDGARLAATRICLHARELGFDHPGRKEFVEWRSEVPADMQDVIASLR